MKPPNSQLAQILTKITASTLNSTQINNTHHNSEQNSPDFASDNYNNLNNNNNRVPTTASSFILSTLSLPSSSSLELVARENGPESADIGNSGRGMNFNFLSTNNSSGYTTRSDVDFNSERINLVDSDDDDDAFKFPPVPAFIEAILTLVVCGFLLAASLIIIKKAKIWCAGRGSKYEDDDYEDAETPAEISSSTCSNSNHPYNSNSNSDSVQPPHQSNNHLDPHETNLEPGSTQTQGQGQGQKGQDYSRQSSNQSRSSSRTSSKRGSQRHPHGKCEGARKSPNRVSFVRRASGPFGDDCLEYVEETYKKVKPEQKPYEEKESWARRISTRRLTQRGEKQKHNQHQVSSQSPNPNSPENINLIATPTNLSVDGLSEKSEEISRTNSRTDNEEDHHDREENPGSVSPAPSSSEATLTQP